MMALNTLTRCIVLLCVLYTPAMSAKASNAWESQFACLGDIKLASGRRLGDIDARFNRLFRSPMPNAAEKAFITSYNITHDFRLNADSDADGLPNGCISYAFSCAVPTPGGDQFTMWRGLAQVFLQANEILSKSATSRILFHCLNGRDRTGIVTGALMLAWGNAGGQNNVQFNVDVIPQIDSTGYHQNHPNTPLLPFGGTYVDVQDLVNVYYNGTLYDDPTENANPSGPQTFTYHGGSTVFNWLDIAKAMPGDIGPDGISYGSYNFAIRKWDNGTFAGNNGG